MERHNCSTERLQAAGSRMCRKGWLSNTSKKAASSGCLRTGARRILDITCFIRAAANPPRPSRWWSMRCATAPQRTQPPDKRDGAGESGFIPRLFVKRVALGENIGLVDLLVPVRCLDLLHRDRHRFLAIVERRRHRFGDLSSEF